MTEAQCIIRVCDCWWHDATRSRCYDCTRNKTPDQQRELRDNYISIKDKVDEFYTYLKGEGRPEGVSCSMPRLSKKKAFAVIWFLQEYVHCLPDHIEQCDGCKELYDEQSEGWHLCEDYKLNGKPLPKKYHGNWCEGCVPKVDVECP